MAQTMTEKEFFAAGGPVDAVLIEAGINKWGPNGREAKLDAWFHASTDHNFDAPATAQNILDEIELEASFVAADDLRSDER